MQWGKNNWSRKATANYLIVMVMSGVLLLLPITQLLLSRGWNSPEFWKIDHLGWTKFNVSSMYFNLTHYSNACSRWTWFCFVTWDYSTHMFMLSILHVSDWKPCTLRIYTQHVQSNNTWILLTFRCPSLWNGKSELRYHCDQQWIGSRVV